MHLVKFTKVFYNTSIPILPIVIMNPVCRYSIAPIKKMFYLEGDEVIVIGLPTHIN